MFDPEPDLSAFVGLEWQDRAEVPDGLDCWTLVVRVYRALLGRELPPWDTVGSLHVPATAEAALVEASSGRWDRIEPGHERPLDVALIYRGRLACHVGIVAARGRLLHVERGGTSRVERYRHGEAGGYAGTTFRFEGFYRLRRPEPPREAAA